MTGCYALLHMVNIDEMKERLTAELALVERELKTVGRQNPDNPADWQPTPPVEDSAATEDDEVADKIEDFEQNTAILKQLEIQHTEITKALERIEKGTYGVCEVSGEAIEEDRLEANPSARTCKAHMGEESALNN